MTDVDPDVVRELVDEAVDEYEQRTIIPEDIVREPKTRTDHRCKSAKRVEPDQFNSTQHSLYIGDKIQELVDCETRKFIKELEDNSDEEENISTDEFYMDIVRVDLDANRPLHIFLPKKMAYEIEMSGENAYNSLNLSGKTPIHWFDSDIIDDKGYLIEKGLYVRQRRQGDKSVIAEKFDTTLSRDTSENRLQIRVGRDGPHIGTWFRSKFSVSPLDVGEPLIHTLNLPDQNQL